MVEFVQSKRLLPFYDVFDEQRYFAPAESQRLHCLGGERLALTICEDAWNDKLFWPSRLYSIDPVEELMRAGGSLILNISASPYYRGKRELRHRMLAAIARRHHVPVVMVNQVGGNDSLVFDGASFALGPDGEVVAQARSFEEDLVFFDSTRSAGDRRAVDPSEDAAVYQALVLGTRDYVRKCGFSKVLVGLSGGVDSALVAAIAVDALGKENVTTIGMPSQYSSAGSIDDARALAANLGIRFKTIPIHDLFEQYTRALAPLFAGRASDITEENIQSRIRGNLLMALSNKFNALVLTTGNKSEMSVGYCTLYGDMVGALAVIGDVVKTEVYQLCSHLNRERAVIPRAILEKPPPRSFVRDKRIRILCPPTRCSTRFCRPTSSATKPRNRSPPNTISILATVSHVVKLVERSEYKRQQAAPVLKVTSKSFGMGRRFPIAVKVQV